MTATRQRLLGDRDLRASRRNGDAQALAGRIQLDRDAVVVFHLRDTSAATERETSPYRGVNPVNVVSVLQTGYMPGRSVFAYAYTAESDPANVERVTLTVKDQGPTAPPVAKTRGNLTA